MAERLQSQGQGRVAGGSPRPQRADGTDKGRGKWSGRSSSCPSTPLFGDDSGRVGGCWPQHFSGWTGRKEVPSRRSRDAQMSVQDSGSGGGQGRRSAAISHQLPVQFFDENAYVFSILPKVLSKLTCKTSKPCASLSARFPAAHAGPLGTRDPPAAT